MKTVLSLSALVATVSLVALGAAPAAAASAPEGPPDASGGTALSAALEPLNNSAVTSAVTGTLAGNDLTLEFRNQELLSNARHAQHLYLGKEGVCPDPTTPGTGEDGAVSATDGQDLYGDIVVSLTTSGDTDQDSAYEFQRYPLGSTPYSRTITLTDEVAQAVLANKIVIAQLGTDINGNGRYDGDERSDIIPEIPAEVTHLASCGVLTVGEVPLSPQGVATITQVTEIPVGGVATGGGSTAKPAFLAALFTALLSWLS